MKHRKFFRVLLLALADGDVASVVESTWKDAAGQIKTVVDNVVFRRWI